MLETATLTRGKPEYPELDPLGIWFDRILKFARVVKIFEKNIWGENLHPPPVVRGLTLALLILGLM